MKQTRWYDVIGNTYEMMGHRTLVNRIDTALTSS